jgi:hypothetical protein
MDGRTWQALATGHVELPRRRIHAGLWFRLLRTLIDELGATVTETGADQRLTREVWACTGRAVRAGQLAWRPYEELDLEIQEHTLEAAATAIGLLENGTLTGRGNEAALFLPEPDEPLNPGRPRQAADPVPVQRKGLTDLLHEAVEEARQNPEAARRLFNLAAYGCRGDEDRLQRVRDDFAGLGIPREHLSD